MGSIKFLKTNYLEDIYPLTIVMDRYTGAYSGGKYTAWNLSYWEVPDGPDEGDCECYDFWSSADEKYLIGRGDTPNTAIEDLARRIKDYISNKPQEQ